MSGPAERFIFIITYKAPAEVSLRTAIKPYHFRGGEGAKEVLGVDTKRIKFEKTRRS